MYITLIYTGTDTIDTFCVKYTNIGTHHFEVVVLYVVTTVLYVLLYYSVNEYNGGFKTQRCILYRYTVLFGSYITICTHKIHFKMFVRYSIYFNIDRLSPHVIYYIIATHL